MNILFPQKSLALFFTIFAIFTLTPSASSYAQQARVVFPEMTMSIESSFGEIERQTDYLISVSHTDFDMSRKVRLTANNLSVGEAMTQLLARSRRLFSVHGNHIVVFARNRPEPPKLAAPTPPPAVEEPAPEPVVDPAKPPVDVDSLELALRARKQEPAPTQLLPEPSLDRTAYYTVRDHRTLYTGRPAYLSRMPRFALRTNVLYGVAALAPNLGVEFGLSPRSTLLASGSYNGWWLDDDGRDKMLCHWLASVEYRYWLCERFNGHFFGAHGFYGNFHVKGYDIPFAVLGNHARDFRYKGSVYGAGISYGYQLQLGVHWNVELNAGLGAGIARYDKFNCDRCSDPVTTGVRRRFVAPTKLGASLVFLIK